MTYCWICRRVFHLKESVVWRQQSNEKRSRNLGKISWMFGSRLIATAGTWFLWDFSFYGNKGKAHRPGCCVLNLCTVSLSTVSQSNVTIASWVAIVVHAALSRF